MDNFKRDNYYLDKITADLKFLISHTESLTLADMQKDEVLLDCIMFRLVQISENSGKLSEDFKNTNRQIPWQAIKGLRNRLVHTTAKLT